MPSNDVITDLPIRCEVPRIADICLPETIVWYPEVEFKAVQIVRKELEAMILQKQ